MPLDRFIPQMLLLIQQCIIKRRRNGNCGAKTNFIKVKGDYYYGFRENYKYS